jgi:predicted nucleotidyltransferase
VLIRRANRPERPHQNETDFRPPGSAGGICYDAGMSASLAPPVREALQRAAAAVPELDLLMLFGSRARGDAHGQSDWDFGYVSRVRLDAAGFLATLVETTGSDRIDLVDLQRASGLLRYRVARDADVIHERHPGIADAFRLDAVRFWCDAEPIIQRGYDAVLAELDR